MIMAGSIYRNLAVYTIVISNNRAGGSIVYSKVVEVRPRRIRL